MAEQAFIQAYREELKLLTGPDKPRINTLSMLAEDNRQHAQAIVTCIEKHLHECVPKERLPALYLMDSIIKNVREPYKSLFSKRLEHVFGRVWDSTLPSHREPLSKLVKLWNGHLAPDVLARLQARMAAGQQQAPAAPPVLQQSRPQQQQQQQHAQPLPLPVQQQPVQHPPQQPQVLQQPQFLQPLPGSILLPGQPLMGGFPVMQPMQPAPAQQPGIIVVMGPNGQLVPVGQAPPQPQLVVQQQPMQAIPQHMVPGGLPPVSPAHPSWQPQQQQPLRPMQPPHHQQQQPMVRRSPGYPASPAMMQASPHHSSGRSPHHRPGTSPQHLSAPGSGARSGSPSQQQADSIAASLSSLLQGLTKHTYLNDPALKTTTFDPAFIKKEHKGVIALLKAASDQTRARFKDIQFQRNKRRKAAAASTALHSRSWYLPVNSWITGTTTLQEAAEEQPEQAAEEEGPAPPPTVDADPAQTQCAISHEPFDSFYDQDRETWVYRGAVRLTGQEAERHGVPDGSIVKVECLAEADLGSSPAALAAAAAAGAAGGAEDDADLAAAALAAPAAGEQQQQEQQQPQQQQQQQVAPVKVEQQEVSAAGGDAGVTIKADPDGAAAGGAAVKQDPSAAGAAAAAAAGLKRELSEQQQQAQGQDGTPSKKPRLSPDP